MRVRIQPTPLWSVKPAFREIARLLQKLHSAYVGERLEAESALQERGPQALSSMTAASDKERAVRDAANRCLPLLLERIDRGRAPEMLLRPSSSPQYPEQMLLRPAAGASGCGREPLLRASQQEE